jgi:hypothetical protein
MHCGTTPDMNSLLPSEVESFNILAPELFVLISAHPVYKM